MAHFPKPFFRPKRQRWYVVIDGKETNLGADQQAAFAHYRDLMANRTAGPDSVRPSILAIIDTFLDWTQKHRAGRTYRWHQENLQSFLKSVDPHREASAVRVFDVTRWIDSHPHWSGTTRHGAMTSLLRAFNWAVQQGLLEKNPVAAIEKPRRQTRNVTLTADQRVKLMAAVTEGPFADLLRFLADTGCRPKEARTLEARHVSLADGMIVFPADEAKGGRDPRVIVLTPAVADIIRPLALKHPVGPIFRNTDNEPWTMNAVRIRFRRLKEAVGVPKLSAYVLRHTFATDALAKGVDIASLAALMGHRDTSMISRVYGHLTQRVDHLREQAKKAAG